MFEPGGEPDLIHARVWACWRAWPDPCMCLSLVASLTWSMHGARNLTPDGLAAGRSLGPWQYKKNNSLSKIWGGTCVASLFFRLWLRLQESRCPNYLQPQLHLLPVGTRWHIQNWFTRKCFVEAPAIKRAAPQNWEKVRWLTLSSFIRKIWRVWI